MRIYHAYFSFEVQPETGAQSLVFSHLGQARKECADHLRFARQDEVESFAKYNADLPKPDDLAELTCEISEVDTPPITRETLCKIINTQGGSYTRSERKLLTITLRTNGRMRFEREKGGA